MAFRTNSLSSVVTDLNDTMIRLKKVASAGITQLNSGPTDARYVLSIRQRAIKVLSELNTISKTAGIVDHIRKEVNDQTYAVDLEFTKVVAALTALQSGIESAFPVNADGYLLIEKLDAVDTVERTFTVAETTGVRSLLQTVVNSIA